MQEKKELKVGDWVRVKRNLAVHEIGVKYLGKVYRINRINIIFIMQEHTLIANSGIQIITVLQKDTGTDHHLFQ